MNEEPNPLESPSASPDPEESSGVDSASDLTMSPDAGQPTDLDAVAPEEGAFAAGEVADAGPTEGESADEPSEAAAASETTDSESEGGKKKRRRRRRKKKGQATAGEGGAEAKPEKSSGNAPFLRFFEGHAGGRRHAFAVGEIVAGRVLGVTDGTFTVDLFGKAIATVDRYEPREVPEPVEAEPPAQLVESTIGETETPTAEAEAGGEVAEHAPSIAEESPSEDVPREAGAVAETAPASTASEPTEPETPPQAADPESEPQVASPDDQAGAVVASADSESEEESDDEEVTFEPEPEGPPPEAPAVGTIFRGRVGAVSESGHVAIVNRIPDAELARKRIEKAREERRRVRGLVFGFNRGGFDVLVEGLRAFCPSSGMDLADIDDPRAYLGQKLEFGLPQKAGGPGIIVSRRSILEREARKRARQYMKTLTVGQRLKGTVAQVRDFGLLVDIGEGLEGLVHQSEVSWKRGVRPADVAIPGDEVEVEVLKIQPATRKERHGRLSLSLRATQADPWDEHAELLKEGSHCKGKVVRTAEFGAFVELAPGLDGLLHISELGKDLKHANQVLSEGTELDIVIERVDRKQRRISLSKLSPAEVQAIEAGEFDPKTRPRALRPGSHVEVVVERVEHHGIIVQIAGVLGKRGRGFIPNRDLGSFGGGERKKNCAPGTTVTAKISSADRDGGWRMSVKAREVDEERRAVKEYRREAAKQGFGTFGDLLRAKLGDTSTEK